MRCLFLDIDGVLNNRNTKGAWLDICRPHLLEPTLVAIVRTFVARHDLKVVLSSMWRIEDADYGSGYGRTLNCLQARGWPDCRSHFIGVTPHLPERPRGHEITQWLREGVSTVVTSFVVFDDLTNMDTVADRLVLIDAEHGVRRRDLQRAARILLTPRQISV